MTDALLVAKKLAFIETCLGELRALGHPDRIRDDLRERRFIEHTLQIAIQAAMDVASHIVSDGRYGEPGHNRQLFQLLASNGWLGPEAAARLSAMAGFRNILVHGYAEVDVEVLIDVVDHRLGDLERFVASVRQRLELAG